MTDWRVSAACLAAGAALGAGLTYSALQLSRRQAAPAAPAAGKPAAAPRPAATLENFLEDEVLSEHLTRNVQFFGEEGQLRVARSFVVVVGLGGVGSHAAHMLLRSGVGRLRLIDFDQATLSSLNRHAVATRADVGLPKATVLERHFREIMPEAQLDCRVEMYTADREEELLGGSPDFVIDAIDNIDTKVALVAACARRGLRCLAVAGAGAKADPTRLKFVDIAESSLDPLARALRTRLRKEGVEAGVPVLLSCEKPRCQLVALGDEAAHPSDYQIVPNFRVRTIPVLGTTPAAFGMAAAAHVLCALAGMQPPLQGEPLFKLSASQYERALERLRDRERQRYGSDEGVGVDLDDIVYLLREAWRGLSARCPGGRVGGPGGDKGLQRATAHLTFTRWDAARPATADNLVLLGQAEAEEHEALWDTAAAAAGPDSNAGEVGPGGGVLAALAAREPAFCARVEGVLDRVRRELFY